MHTKCCTYIHTCKYETCTVSHVTVIRTWVSDDFSGLSSGIHHWRKGLVQVQIRLCRFGAVIHKFLFWTVSIETPTIPASHTERDRDKRQREWRQVLSFDHQHQHQRQHQHTVSQQQKKTSTTHSCTLSSWFRVVRWIKKNVVTPAPKKSYWGPVFIVLYAPTSISVRNVYKIRIFQDIHTHWCRFLKEADRGGQPRRRISRKDNRNNNNKKKTTKNGVSNGIELSGFTWYFWRMLRFVCLHDVHLSTVGKWRDFWNIGINVRPRQEEEEEEEEETVWFVAVSGPYLKSIQDSVTTRIPPVLFPPVWLFGNVDVCGGNRQRWTKCIVTPHNDEKTEDTN